MDRLGKVNSTEVTHTNSKFLNYLKSGQEYQPGARYHEGIWLTERTAVKYTD
jgi:hypothetical protein